MSCASETRSDGGIRSSRVEGLKGKRKGVFMYNETAKLDTLKTEGPSTRLGVSL